MPTALDLPTRVNAYWKTKYLARVNWRDGTEAYCKHCDAHVPLLATGDQLACSLGHAQHPANVILSRGVE